MIRVPVLSQFSTEPIDHTARSVSRLDRIANYAIRQTLDERQAKASSREQVGRTVEHYASEFVVFEITRQWFS